MRSSLRASCFGISKKLERYRWINRPLRAVNLRKYLCALSAIEVDKDRHEHLKFIRGRVQGCSSMLPVNDLDNALFPSNCQQAEGGNSIDIVPALDVLRVEVDDNRIREGALWNVDVVSDFCSSRSNESTLV